MNNARRGALLGALSATALVLSACGSGDTTGTPAPAPTVPPAAESSSAAPSTSAAAPASGGDITKPGTVLKVGDRAVVPFEYGSDKKGTIAITVTAIEKGETADLAKFGDKAKDIVPYYIRATVENVGGTDLSYSSLQLHSVAADGGSNGVIISGDVDKCESESADENFKTPGAKFDTCVLQAARVGDAVGGATYDKGDAYEDSPVVWKN
jgi:hypothetical protein